MGWECRKKPKMDSTKNENPHFLSVYKFFVVIGAMAKDEQRMHMQHVYEDEVAKEYGPPPCHYLQRKKNMFHAHALRSTPIFPFFVWLVCDTTVEKSKHQFLDIWCVQRKMQINFTIVSRSHHISISFLSMKNLLVQLHRLWDGKKSLANSEIVVPSTHSNMR